MLVVKTGIEVLRQKSKSKGAYHRPQDLAPLPVGVELGFEAVARVPTKAGVELLGPVVVVLFDLPLTVVDDCVGLAVAVLSRFLYNGFAAFWRCCGLWALVKSV